jgi:hypothetical protein
MSFLLALGAMAVSVLLAVNLLLGWATSLRWISAPAHINLSFVAAIAVLFSQAMLLFYLVGSGRRVRQVLRERKLAPELADGLPPARSVLPVAALAILAVMAAFILGGGAHTGAVPPALHGWIALGSVILQCWSMWQELVALSRLEQTIQAVEEVVA